jgi:hypothetical protein
MDNKNNIIVKNGKNKLYHHIWLTIKSCLGIICLILFLYHLLSLTIDYFGYKTVINSRYIRPTNLTMPAVTICAPVPIAFKRLCDINETMDNCYERLDNKNMTYKPDLLAELINNYLTNGKAMRSNINNDDWILSIDCSIAKSKQRGNFSSPLIRCIELSNIIESIIYNTNKRSVVPDYCHTYFSMFDTNYAASKYVVNLIDFGNLMAVIFIDLTYERWFPQWYHERGINIFMTIFKISKYMY